MELNLGKPNEKQRLFLTDTHSVVGYGGARGGGKSWAVRTKATVMALSHGGIKQLIVRRTYPELTNSGIKRPCSPIRATVSGNWFLPTPREALTNEEILVILRKMDQLRDKLASARSLCSETVSGVLGI